MSRYRPRMHELYREDDMYYPYRSRGYDYDYPITVNGRMIGHLLPGNVVNPVGRARGGMEMQDLCCSNGLPPFGHYDEDYDMDIDPRWLRRGFPRVSNYFHGDCGANPYDPRYGSATSQWCPGAGIGLPNCSFMDTTLGGHFRLRRCPGGLCHDFY
ncbi:uncharacterized protein LOC119651978 isoform X2 [Hermetia illucens]|uniref:uncharacterized protein LOC119651978 isoform X2 n=1 Tax=Hermetia illucens TaxID=343691 RepID=UPI0018CC52A6|nr:uncharacterized protein LOC119651978 isoform X2 [Hermetia illucens]